MWVVSGRTISHSGKEKVGGKLPGCGSGGPTRIEEGIVSVCMVAPTTDCGCGGEETGLVVVVGGVG